MTLAPHTVDRVQVRQLKDAEDARFRAEHPRSIELRDRARRSMPNGVPMAWFMSSYHDVPPWVVEGHGARFTDVDGHTYHDFNIADMSMFCGYGPEPLVRAVSDRIARGNQFLLPGEDAIVVSEALAARYGLPKWQYTVSASQANTEAIRVARVVTGRDKVLLFDGHYLGHFDQSLVELDDTGVVVPEERGVPAGVVDQTLLVPLNDLGAVEAALAPRDVALVLTEPALTAAEVDGSATIATLTAGQASRTVLTNYNQTADAVIGLAIPARGLAFVAVVGKAGNNKWAFKSYSTSQIMLDGTALTARMSAKLATPAVGNYISCWTFRSTSHTAWQYQWLCRTGLGSGTWTTE